ncbi:MAG: putative zinc-binding metallopeptidase [Pirellulales bacterium]
MCDLSVVIEGTQVEPRVDRLYEELARHNVRLRPHCWISEEWFSPDGIPGIAIPFYLAHPRLAKLEQRQMYEVEGGSHDWCMRILRHEAGHAVETAYRLGRRRKWQQLFGKASKPYPEFYRPKPYSRSFVLHLESWYAQSHPSEDFAETFAVWLNPNSAWRRRYKGWPAMKKIAYVDELMTELAGTAPPVRSRREVDPLHRLTKTLREHYTAKKEHYGVDVPAVYDRDLRRLFSDLPRDAKRETAAAFLRRIGPQLRSSVAEWTGEHSYTVDQVLRETIARCRQLQLRTNRPESRGIRDATIFLTVQTMNFVHSGHRRVAL